MATSADFVKAVQAKINEISDVSCSRSEAELAVKAVFSAIGEVVMEGEAGNSLRTSIGTFVKRHRPARTARNPRDTNAVVEVAARDVLTFRANSKTTQIKK